VTCTDAEDSRGSQGRGSGAYILDKLGAEDSFLGNVGLAAAKLFAANAGFGLGLQGWAETVGLKLIVVLMKVAFGFPSAL
jgi:hypothetical protein